MAPADTVNAGAPVGERRRQLEPEPIDDVGGVDGTRPRHHDEELLASVAAQQVALAHDAVQHPREHPQGAVAGIVAVGVVEDLEVIEVEDHHGIRRAAARQQPHRVLQAAPVQQTRERIGARLQFALRHRGEQTDPRAELLGDAGHEGGVGGRERLGVPARQMEHPVGGAHDADRHAQGTRTVAAANLQVRTGIERIAAVEPERVAVAHGRTTARHVDRARHERFVTVGPRNDGEVGTARVGQQDLAADPGEGEGHGPDGDIERALAILGHLECTDHLRLEQAAIALCCEQPLALGGGPALCEQEVPQRQCGEGEDGDGRHRHVADDGAPARPHVRGPQAARERQQHRPEHVERDHRPGRAHRIEARRPHPPPGGARQRRGVVVQASLHATVIGLDARLLEGFHDLARVGRGRRSGIGATNRVAPGREPGPQPGGLVWRFVRTMHD
jgi:hypothetical protein